MQNEEYNLQELIDYAAEHEDQTVAQSSFERELPPEGPTMVRLVEYIELGKQQQRAFQGKAKAPAPEVKITFEICDADQVVEVDKDGEKVRYPAKISLMAMTKSTHEKSKYTQLFRKMRYNRENVKHMAQMLGEPFVATIKHITSKNGKVYASIQDESGFLIAPPFQINPVTKKKEVYPCEERISPLRIFLWDRPTKGSWDALYIDGSYEMEDKDGNKITKSKNFIQETLLNATNFAGSPLEQMLQGGDALPDATPTVTKTTRTSAAKATKQVAPKAEPIPEDVVESNEENDFLADFEDELPF